MTASDCEIALATVDDIPGIVELQGLNLLSNGGFLSIKFSNDWFERVLSEMPIIIARKKNRIVGYLVSSPVSVAAHAPIIQAKLRAYPGSGNPYNHGPVCIAKDERNQGLIARMFALGDRPARLVSLPIVDGSPSDRRAGDAQSHGNNSFDPVAT